MRTIAVLYSGNSHQHRTFNEPKYNRYLHKIIYLPDFQASDLEGVDVLLIPSQLHMGQLGQNKAVIAEYLACGGTVAALGAQSKDLLPSHRWEFRPTNFWWWLEKDAKSGLALAKPEHDLFRYITLSDATWHYHGVFFPPAGTEPLIEVEDDGVIFYIDKITTPGTLIMTTLDPEYHYGSYFMPATERFLDGFLPWLAEGVI